MLKDRQTTARTMPKLERTETEIKSFCDRKRNVLITRVWSAGGDPPTGGGGREGKKEEGGPREAGGAGKQRQLQADSAAGRLSGASRHALRGGGCTVHRLAEPGLSLFCYCLSCFPVFLVGKGNGKGKEGIAEKIMRFLTTQIKSFMIVES